MKRENIDWSDLSELVKTRTNDEIAQIKGCHPISVAKARTRLHIKKTRVRIEPIIRFRKSTYLHDGPCSHQFPIRVEGGWACLICGEHFTFS